MATRLEDLLQQEKTFTNRLEERRAQFNQANELAGQRFSGAVETGKGNLVSPADAFGAFRSFQRAGQEFVNPASQNLSNIRGDIIDERKLQLLEQPEAEGLSQTDLAKLAVQQGSAQIVMEDGKLVVKGLGDVAGGFDVTTEAQSIIAGDKKLSDIPKAQQSAVQKEIKSLRDEKATFQQQRIYTAIDEILEDESTFGGAKSVSGGFQWFADRKGTKAADILAKFNFIKDNLTLENLDLMSGVLSETDIKILASAASELSRSQSEDEFVKTLKKLKKTLGGSEVSSKIKVKLKDGRIGTIDEADFNEEEMERIE